MDSARDELATAACCSEVHQRLERAATERRYDFGFGLATCAKCGVRPICNRGCRRCQKRFCKKDYRQHISECLANEILSKVDCQDDVSCAFLVKDGPLENGARPDLGDAFLVHLEEGDWIACESGDHISGARQIAYSCKPTLPSARRIREVQLPGASQTHEIYYDKATSKLFITQMSTSTLVTVNVGKEGMSDKYQATLFGPRSTDPSKIQSGESGIAGLHNVSQSYKWKGKLWLSLQMANVLMLVDADTLQVEKRLQVPTQMQINGKTANIGGPHCIREAPDGSGEIWVALKGAVGCLPWPCDSNGKAHSVKGAIDIGMPQACAEEGALRRCCSPHKVLGCMDELNQMHGLDCPTPDSWAVWHVNPDDYDINAPDKANGGRLYPCHNSPPMMAPDENKRCWVSQDSSPDVIFIDANSETRHTEQLKVDVPSQATGPGIVAAPDGGIWCCLLGEDGKFVRFDPKTNESRIYDVGEGLCEEPLRMFHLAFHEFTNTDGHVAHIMYALSSDLVDKAALCGVVVVRFKEGSWTEFEDDHQTMIPLPTQHSASHRLCVVDPGPGATKHLVVTELSASKLAEIQLDEPIA